MLTSEEAAARLGIARSTLRRWVRLGLVAAKRTPGGHLRFDETAIDRVLLPAQENPAVERLRAAGCTCDRPLLGYRPDVGPRCRLCGTVADDREPISRLIANLE